jgi:hypothetical protein
MNRERRKKIMNIHDELENVVCKLNDILDDEQMAFDSMPEGLQSSQRGEDSEESIDNMSEAIEYIERAIEMLDDICI